LDCGLRDGVEKLREENKSLKEELEKDRL